jgi:hypothetical protein
MNIQKVSMLLAITVLLGGCSSTKYTECHGTQVLVGEVGTPRNVDGIDFWENGIPSRKYKILGIIGKSSKQHVPLGRLSKAFSSSDDSDDRDAAIAKVARKHGGDGVVPVGGGGQSDAGDSGSRKHQRVVLVAIKYVE